jgi:hypothetical protein
VTFPVVAARTPTNDVGNSFAHSIGLGSPSAGDLLIVFATSSNANGPYFIDPGSGPNWEVIGGGVGTNIRLLTLAKLATGSDALTLHTVNSVRMSSTCYRITGHGLYVSGGSTTTGLTANADPPAASITGSAQDILFLTALGSGTSVASGAPSSYGTLTTGGAVAFLSVAERTLNGTTDNPGAFTSAAQDWVATTIAVPELALSTLARLTQAAVEIVSDATPAAQLTQIAAELVSTATPSARLTQIAVELVSQNVPNGSGAGPGMLIIAT